MRMRMRMRIRTRVQSLPFSLSFRFFRYSVHLEIAFGRDNGGVEHVSQLYGSILPRYIVERGLTVAFVTVVIGLSNSCYLFFYVGLYSVEISVNEYTRLGSTTVFCETIEESSRGQW